MRGNADFLIAEEGGEYDYLLVIGAAQLLRLSQRIEARRELIRMWDENHIENIIQNLNDGSEV
jgi:hypothetical protein